MDRIISNSNPIRTMLDMNQYFGNLLHDLIQIRSEKIFKYEFGFILIRSKFNPLTSLSRRVLL